MYEYSDKVLQCDNVLTGTWYSRMMIEALITSEQRLRKVNLCGVSRRDEINKYAAVGASSVGDDIKLDP